MATWTLIDEHTPRPVDIDEGLQLDAAALGWERKPEGLCRGEVCIPVPDPGPLTLPALARLLGRPLAMDPEHGVAALGAGAPERGAALRSGLAPDFALPDVDGGVHRLSQYRGRKVALYVYGTW